MSVRPPSVPPLVVAALAALAGAALAGGRLPAQLPAPFAPAQNPPTPEKVVLGKFLFWEEQLSSDDSMACGTCHLPEFGGGDGRPGPMRHPGPDGVYGTDDDIHGSAGVVRQAAGGDFAPDPVFGLDPRVTRRTAPTVLGAAHHPALLWDLGVGGRFDDPETGQTQIPFGGALEAQSVGPILDPGEMAVEGRTWQDVRTKLQGARPLALAGDLPADLVAARQQNPTYPALFQAAFGDPSITATRIAFALASYQRSLNPDDTPWDRFALGQPGALTPLEQQGWALFQGSARCSACHLEPLFSDDLPHNLGLRWAIEDPGAFLVTGMPDDVGAFKTPTLRNAGLRTRLFHNGQSVPLDDPGQLGDATSTLNIYLQGGGVDRTNLDPFLLPLQQLGVTAADLVLVQDFVRTALTDPRAALALPPFDHPALRSAAVPPLRAFGHPLAGARAPFFVDAVPAFPGNAAYKLGLAGGDGPGLAVLTWGRSSVEPFGTVVGLPWHVAAAGALAFALQGPTGEVGHATWRLPLPADPTLDAAPFYFQLFVFDPQAPGGIAASPGLELVVR